MVLSLITGTLMSLSSTTYGVTNGTVKFTGKIMETTCTISGGSALSVPMGAFLKSEIKNKGDKVSGSERDFDIKLTGCPVVTGAPVLMSIAFTGTADLEDDKLLKLDATGAEGIGIGLYDKDGNQISLNSASYEYPDAINSANVNIPFKVAYVANGQSGVAGKAEATLNFDISYK